MVQVTLFEIDLQDATFTAPNPVATLGGNEQEENHPSAEESSPDTAESTGGVKRTVAVALGMVFLIALAVVARRKFGGSDAEAP